MTVAVGEIGRFVFEGLAAWADDFVGGSAGQVSGVAVVAGQGAMPVAGGGGAGFSAGSVRASPGGGKSLAVPGGGAEAGRQRKRSSQPAFARWVIDVG